ncbi:phosphotransferase enzyme family domain protein [Fusarium subglutinans]|uniref:Phosphotransferase enzyme family domain protein n=1 Tax=Gibberella subglutinans TaxID=42677 RepID=A0A8H5Q698_GIBSU|nr:phosphotransferase enzyme family domain protein [Fusarium subglutinans]KAF5609615.1 phosphotransferase enzyme family domain protein [Fusarium subglutinans]
MEAGTYDGDSYNKLPSIGEAAAAFTAINGNTLLDTAFRDLFVHHGMDRTFGLILLHRHFELGANERLVEYKGTSVPWLNNELATNIRPHNWYLSSGKVFPYEFYHSLSEDGPTLDLNNPDQQAFLDQFAKLLSRENAENLFGLCRYPGDDFEGRIEITQGRSNINLSHKDVCKLISFLIQ